MLIEQRARRRAADRARADLIEAVFLGARGEARDVAKVVGELRGTRNIRDPQAIGAAMQASTAHLPRLSWAEIMKNGVH